MRLLYRASDDSFVIRDDKGVVDAQNATDFAARRVIDPEMLKHGMRRYLDFKDWQVRFAGKVLFSGTPGEASNTLERDT